MYNIEYTRGHYLLTDKNLYSLKCKFLIKKPSSEYFRSNQYWYQQSQFQRQTIYHQIDPPQVKYQEKLNNIAKFIPLYKTLNISDITILFLLSSSTHQNPTVVVTKEPGYEYSISNQHSELTTSFLKKK